MKKNVLYRVEFKLPAMSTRTHSTNLTKNAAFKLEQDLREKFPNCVVFITEEIQR